MVIDSSALVAILRAEPGYIAFVDAISAAEIKVVAAPTLLETSMVLSDRKGSSVLPKLDGFLGESEINVLPFTAEHALAAREAFLRYGKGRHPAGLNSGDCIAYATAKLERMPLLFKGDDFRKTDIRPAL
jgi:ribonuclease VapC